MHATLTALLFTALLRLAAMLLLASALDNTVLVPEQSALQLSCNAPLPGYAMLDSFYPAP